MGRSPAPSARSGRGSRPRESAGGPGSSGEWESGWICSPESQGESAEASRFSFYVQVGLLWRGVNTPGGKPGDKSHSGWVPKYDVGFREKQFRNPRPNPMVGSDAGLNGLCGGEAKEGTGIIVHAPQK